METIMPGEISCDTSPDAGADSDEHIKRGDFVRALSVEVALKSDILNSRLAEPQVEPADMTEERQQ